MDDPVERGRGVRKGRISDRRNMRRLDDGVGEQLARDTAHAVRLEIALNQVASRGRDRKTVGQAQFGRLNGGPPGPRIRLSFRRTDINLPKHVLPLGP